MWFMNNGAHTRHCLSDLGDLFRGIRGSLSSLSFVFKRNTVQPYWCAQVVHNFNCYCGRICVGGVCVCIHGGGICLCL